jgi:hypothetical protein
MSPDMVKALWQVSLKQAERICAPGKWKVWREGDRLRWEVLGK